LGSNTLPLFALSREFAPVLDDPSDLRKMDIVLRKFDKKKSFYFYSGILEGKRPKYDQDDIITVEQQLHEYSCGYLDSCDEDSLWDTTLGTKIRICFTRGGDNLTAYYPQTTAFHTDAPYIDANTLDTTGLEKAFEYIHINPWPTEKTRGVSPDIPTQSLSSNPFSGPTAPAPLVQTSSYSAAVTSYGTGSYGPSNYDPITRTVPIIQPPTQDASDLVGTKTADRGRISSPSDEGSQGDGSHEQYPLIPDDAIYVDVEVETKKGGHLYHFSYNNQHYIKGESDWVDRTAVVDGKSFECVLCTGKKSGLNFYTWSLMRLQQYKGKGKR
jgi:hypothetical protein